MKDDKVYLEYIMDSFRKNLDYGDEMTLDLFLKDTKTQDACIRQLEVIGEVTKRLIIYAISPTICRCTVERYGRNSESNSPTN